MQKSVQRPVNGHDSTSSIQRLIPFVVLNTARETLSLNLTCFDILSLLSGFTVTYTV